MTTKMKGVKKDLIDNGFVFIQEVKGINSKVNQELYERGGDELVIYDQKTDEIIWHDTNERYQNEKPYQA